MEPVTIVVMPRDRFSVMETCLDAIIRHTPQPFEFWVFSGGTPESAKKRWAARYGGRVQFTFFPEFRNGSELRTIALSNLKTKLALFVDSDVFVREGWFEPLVRCQRETGCAMVMPLILDRDERIHTAGNDFFLMSANGVDYMSMELRYQNHRVMGRTKLKRREVEFCEVHCTLIDVQPVRKAHPFDGALREFQEMDTGLTLGKHGCKMYVEPESVVYLDYETRLSKPEDMRLHLWKWDMKAMREGFAYFRKKWGYDIDPHGSFDRYLRFVDRRVGFFSRRWPTGLSAKLDRIELGFRKWRGVGP